MDRIYRPEWLHWMLPAALAGLVLLAATSVWEIGHHPAGDSGDSPVQGPGLASPRSVAVAPVPPGLPSVDDLSWVDYYRNRRDGVFMSVHLPPQRTASGVVVWEKFVEEGKHVTMLSRVRYDCDGKTRTSEAMAIYHDRHLDGYTLAIEPKGKVEVATGAVEHDALALACFGRHSDPIEDDPS